MDALPMQEDTDLAFKSQVEGRMHACGHDSHTAMLSLAARLLDRHRDRLAGNVVLLKHSSKTPLCGRHFFAVAPQSLRCRPIGPRRASPVWHP